MCLTIDFNQKPEVASEDIVVYKHLIRRRRGSGFLTSFRLSEIEIGLSYYAELNKIYDKVYEGLHSYASCEIAKQRAIYWNEVLVKCIIPKGSTYYKGTFESLGDAYASDTLIYNEVINI